jgi:ABC-2 type transport system ATP-binding protein
MLLGLMRASAGQAYLLGERVPVGWRCLQRVGALIEEPALYPWMSGWRNVQVLAPRGVGSREVAEALEKVDLLDVARRKVRTYSQGMRQRLAVAVALCGNPKVVVLDEPANGLDPAGIRDFRALLPRLADAGCSVFVSSHQLGEVERVCDRVAIIHRGRIIAGGAIDELGGEDALVRVGVPQGQEGRARELLAPLRVATAGPGCLVVHTGSGSTVNELLTRGGVYPESVSVERPTLEERFLDLTEEPEAADASTAR